MPESRLQAFGIWAEIVAAFAVVVSLIFVGLEVRQSAEDTALNTEITRAAAYDRRMEELNRLRLTIASDPDLARLWREHLNASGSGTSAPDPRLQFPLNVAWGIYENSYYANQYGLLGASEWGRFQDQICVRYQVYDTHSWDEMAEEEALPITIRGLLTNEFADFVEASC